MGININSCKTAITKVKTNINKCFTACDNRGSNYSQSSNTTSELIKKINAISNISDNVTGTSFSGFEVTWAEITDSEGNTTLPDQYTINFGSVGVSWRAITIYSDTKEGHFTINKISGNKCIISADYRQDITDYAHEEGYGVFMMARGTYRADYVINGGSITFTNDEYPSTGNHIDDSLHSGAFREMPTQISTEINDYYANQYKLDKITVMV